VPKPVRVSDSESAAEGERKTRALGEREGSLETVPKRSRRVFSAADKLRIVKEADRCLASGKRGALGAMLRREGIYSSLVSSWRAQLGAHGAAGLDAKKAGRKPKLSEAERLNVQLLKRNAELERKLHVANVLIALQKKAHEVLGIALPESDGDD
jgi:transposase